MGFELFLPHKNMGSKEPFKIMSSHVFFLKRVHDINTNFNNVYRVIHNTFQRDCLRIYSVWAINIFKKIKGIKNSETIHLWFLITELKNNHVGKSC